MGIIRKDMRGYGILGDDKPDWVYNTVYGGSDPPKSELCVLNQPCILA